MSLDLPAAKIGWLIAAEVPHQLNNENKGLTYQESNAG